MVAIMSASYIELTEVSLPAGSKEWLEVKGCTALSL